MTQQEIPSAVREGKPGSSMYPESSLGENVPGISDRQRGRLGAAG